MDVNPFQIKEIDSSVNYAEIEIEPLEAGYGHTLGNALRRVLLSSLSGYAITSVSIDGVTHQFTSLDGMSEDLVDLILNLKQIRFKSDLKHDGVCRLNVKGKANPTVTAADVECEAGFEIVNKDLYLATLEPNAKLSVEMTIGYGSGYTLATEGKSSTGNIPVDALFSPIVKVAYSVDATRVGRRTDFDKLIVKIWTDGSIAPREALEEAARILVKQFQMVVNPSEQPIKEDAPAVSPQKAEVLKLTVEELDLPTRIANALRKGGYATVGDLVVVQKGVVAKVKNLGDKSVDIVQQALQQKNVDFAG